MSENGQKVRFYARPAGHWLAWLATVVGALVGVVSMLVGIWALQGDEAERAEAKRATTPALSHEREPAASGGPTFASSSKAPSATPVPSVSETGAKSVPDLTRSPSMTTKAETMPRYFLGEWSGMLTQGGSSYSVRMEIQEGEIGEPVGTVEYETLHCAGNLKLRTASPGSVELAETITSSGGCTPEGNIALKRNSNGSLSYSYFHSAGSVTTTGTLKRAGS